MVSSERNPARVSTAFHVVTSQTSKRSGASLSLIIALNRSMDSVSASLPRASMQADWMKGSSWFRKSLNTGRARGSPMRAREVTISMSWSGSVSRPGQYGQWLRGLFQGVFARHADAQDLVSVMIVRQALDDLVLVAGQDGIEGVDHHVIDGGVADGGFEQGHQVRAGIRCPRIRRPRSGIVI